MPQFVGVGVCPAPFPLSNSQPLGSHAGVHEQLGHVVRHVCVPWGLTKQVCSPSKCLQWVYPRGVRSNEKTTYGTAALDRSAGRYATGSQSAPHSWFDGGTLVHRASWTLCSKHENHDVCVFSPAATRTPTTCNLLVAYLPSGLRPMIRSLLYTARLPANLSPSAGISAIQPARQSCVKREVSTVRAGSPLLESWATSCGVCLPASISQT